MSDPVKGTCNCGQVEVTLLDGLPEDSSLCSCTDCRNTSGSIFSVCFTVLSDRFSQSGPTKTYTKKGSSGKDMIRTFCSNCGSAVSQFEEAIAGKTYIQAGLFPPGSVPQPGVELYSMNREEWQPQLAKKAWDTQGDTLDATN